MLLFTWWILDDFSPRLLLEGNLWLRGRELESLSKISSSNWWSNLRNFSSINFSSNAMTFSSGKLINFSSNATFCFPENSGKFIKFHSPDDKREQCVTKLNYLRSIIVMNFDIDTTKTFETEKKNKGISGSGTKGRELKQKWNKSEMSLRNTERSFFYLFKLTPAMLSLRISRITFYFIKWRLPFPLWTPNDTRRRRNRKAIDISCALLHS